MALNPENDKHRNQIEAGTKGRKKGHNFEKQLENELNSIDVQIFQNLKQTKKPNIYMGNPAAALISYISADKQQKIKRIQAYWLGGRATAKEGDILFNDEGEEVTASKSDIVLNVTYENNQNEIIGVSVKSSRNNVQLALTTVAAFCSMLRDNYISVSEHAEIGLKMFCGEAGYRPQDGYIPYDKSNIPENRTARMERWYWEEIPSDAQLEWENIFNENQLKITMLLLQSARAYKRDSFQPTYILHECKQHESIDDCEVAVISVESLAQYSKMFDKFGLKGKKVSKGSYAGIDMAVHMYPHFGFIQFQPIGNKQNFSELQFNLKAKYYNKFKKILEKNNDIKKKGYK